MCIDKHDQRTRRCPRLGHEVKFEYCRQGSRVSGCDCPCRKILDCWFESFDVESFVLEHYGQEGLDKILAEPTPKIASLVDLIQQAQKAVKKPKEDE